MSGVDPVSSGSCVCGQPVFTALAGLLHGYCAHNQGV
jgi:hypothetical protein